METSYNGFDSPYLKRNYQDAIPSEWIHFNLPKENEELKGEEKSTARKMLEEVAILVSGDRDRTHGSKKENFNNIAAVWNGYIQQRMEMHNLHEDEGPDDPLIRGEDVCALMVLLKVARTLHGEPNKDDWMDAAGYAACGFEIEHGDSQ